MNCDYLLTFILLSAVWFVFTGKTNNEICGDRTELVRDPRDRNCRTFIYCSATPKVKRICPLFTMFNPNNRVCDHPLRVDCPTIKRLFSFKKQNFGPFRLFRKRNRNPTNQNSNNQNPSDESPKLLGSTQPDPNLPTPEKTAFELCAADPQYYLETATYTVLDPTDVTCRRYAECLLDDIHRSVYRVCAQGTRFNQPGMDCQKEDNVICP